MTFLLNFFKYSEKILLHVWHVLLSKYMFFNNRNTPAHTILTFVCKALNNQLNYYLSTSEIAEYLYLARLLYSQCQGAFLIKEHDLNKAIAQTAKLVCLIKFFL